ncbi:beta-1,3-galactosyl-O-glycosyl-glycoprotein beta-1,6-N-acetylglucosaminyltransferase [Patella vulgata]|uniref:beta-1,3-galactosyl-O-glycosyl-glycoprotein beta-1,6-N-acetylglucosaminyltransferase n=1 Tax=Patella vulgata TaxID=6465 RepID=UPI00217FB756|nr:beta-1,3-galactosyl-O-glycosyl-glycoprotein beta-1,6-N-acetylglucosaminyltransferase [Patella vulgata]
MSLLQRTAILRCILLLLSLQLICVTYLTTQTGYIQGVLNTARFSSSSRFFYPNHQSMVKLKNDYYQSHYKSCQHSVVIENNISCIKIISNLTSASPMATNKKRLCNLTKISENCQLFRQINGYEDKVVTKLEEDFPLAFGIRLHKSPVQMEQILRIIYRPHNFYCIHVDNGSDIRVFNSLKSVARCFDNVIVLSQIRTVYSSIRLVEADLLCMKEAMKSTIQWKYFLNMAGQELPLKTNLEIVQICQLFQGRNDIESEAMPSQLEERIRFHHVFKNRRPYHTTVTKPPFQYPIEFRKGSAYGVLCRDFVQFALYSEIATKLVEYLSDTEAPEETFLSTLNFMHEAPGGTNVTISHYKKTYLSRAVIWMWDKIKCQGTFQRGVCIFHSGALPWLTKQPQVIGNKVSTAYDQIVIDCMEEFLHNKSVQIDFSVLNTTKYKNYPHIPNENIN